jgi:hypothetical protein
MRRNYSDVIPVCRGVRWAGLRVGEQFGIACGELATATGPPFLQGGAMGSALAALALTVILVMASAVVLVLVRL